MSTYYPTRIKTNINRLLAQKIVTLKYDQV